MKSMDSLGATSEPASVWGTTGMIHCTCSVATVLWRQTTHSCVLGCVYMQPLVKH